MSFQNYVYEARVTHDLKVLGNMHNKAYEEIYNINLGLFQSTQFYWTECIQYFNLVKITRGLITARF